jgi:hypothetical protein
LRHLDGPGDEGGVESLDETRIVSSAFCCRKSDRKFEFP